MDLSEQSYSYQVSALAGLCCNAHTYCTSAKFSNLPTSSNLVLVQLLATVEQWELVLSKSGFHGEFSGKYCVLYTNDIGSLN